MQDLYKSVPDPSHVYERRGSSQAGKCDETEDHPAYPQGGEGGRGICGENLAEVIEQVGELVRECEK
jgi:hypothetical protein